MEQEQWFRENGPDAPELLDHLRRHGAEYDRLLFWSYRYYHSYFGVPLVAARAVLVPTAEEDSLIRVAALDQLFAIDLHQIADEFGVGAPYVRKIAKRNGIIRKRGKGSPAWKFKQAQKQQAV